MNRETCYYLQLLFCAHFVGVLLNLSCYFINLVNVGPSHQKEGILLPSVILSESWCLIFRLVALLAFV